MTNYLTDLNVTEEELRELQTTWTAYCGLTERQRKILDHMHQDKRCKLLYCTIDGKWEQNVDQRLYSGAVYRIPQSVTLPKPDRKEPFKVHVDGKDVWACPVLVDNNRCLVFRCPWTGADEYVGVASSFVGFVGCYDEKMERIGGYDVSLALVKQHRGNLQIKYACFEAEK